jgi:hypothetical protein
LILSLCAVALVSNLACAQTDPYLKYLGDPAPAASNARVVVITPETTSVNITHFDTIKFVSGNESFIWCFNGVSLLSEIDLSRIAPPGMLDHEVRIYIAKSDKDGDGAH